MTALTLFALVVAPAEADGATLLQINGIPYRVTHRIEARSDPCAEWIPILYVEEKGTALKSKPTTESLTEQP